MPCLALPCLAFASPSYESSFLLYCTNPVRLMPASQGVASCLSLTTGEDPHPPLPTGSFIVASSGIASHRFAVKSTSQRLDRRRKSKQKSLIYILYAVLQHNSRPSSRVHSVRFAADERTNFGRGTLFAQVAVAVGASERVSE